VRKTIPIRIKIKRIKFNKINKINKRTLFIGLAVLLVLLITILTVSIVVILRRNAERMKMEDGYTAIASPNIDNRPFLMEIDCIILHATATDTAQEAINTFLEPKSHVSAHFIVDRNGAVTQMVPVGKRAWHAGISQLGGRAHVNDFSIGIEIVNRNDGRQSYTPRQYEAVAALIKHLRTAQGICVAPTRIVSHREVALPHGRKSDPLGFDFARLQRMLAKN